MRPKMIHPGKSPIGNVVEVGDPISHTKKPYTNPFGNDPTIAGPLPAGGTLTCSVTLVGSPTVTYAWKRGFSDVVSGNAATYITTAGDVGKNITCLVTATNPNGFSMARRSNIVVPTL